MSITKVAVAGGTGNLGPAVVNALVEAGFQVTLLSRSSTHAIDSRVKTQVVDYNSLDSLIRALTGQDAVVDVLPSGSIPVEIPLRLIEASHKVGVLRFIPSEYGCDTSHPLTSKLPVFGDKVTVLNRLKELSAQDSVFTYTPVITGPFFDWGLKMKFTVNLSGPSTPIYDGGDTVFSTTTLAGIGRAIAGVLEHPDETKNRNVYVSQAEVTQNKLLAWSGKTIEREDVSTADLEKKAYEAVKSSPPDFRTFAVNLIRLAVFNPAYGGAFAKTDNELLGVHKFSEAEIVDLVKQYS